MSEQPIDYQVLRDDETRDAIYQWWRALGGTPAENDEDAAGNGDARAARAVLRRAKGPDEALLSEGFRRLWFGMPAKRRSQWWMPAWSCVAVVLAEVRRNERDRHFAAALGQEFAKGAGKPVFSELRFRQLQQSQTHAELVLRLRRAVHMLKDQAHVLSLADGILQWHQEHAGQLDYRPARRLAVRWADAYFTEVAKYQKSA